MLACSRSGRQRPDHRLHRHHRGHDINYSYMVQALAPTTLARPVSNCATVMPVPCFTPIPRRPQRGRGGANQINLTCRASTRAQLQHLPRGRRLPAAGLPARRERRCHHQLLDTTVSGGLTYAYVVTAKDITGGCESRQPTAPGPDHRCVLRAAGLRRPAVGDQPAHSCTSNWLEPGNVYCGGPPATACTDRRLRLHPGPTKRDRERVPAPPTPTWRPPVWHIYYYWCATDRAAASVRPTS